MSAQEISLANGVSLLKQGEINDAVDVLEKFTRNNSENSEAFVYLASAYTAQERHNLAIGALKRASELKPKSSQIRFALGQSYEAAGVPKEALKEYKKALEIEPDYGLAKGAYMSLYRRLPEILSGGIEITAH
ncbi:MAG: tetratricopeptide repeat protein [Abditibacteriota bacterium]|nr:tetratricopeptide repeat protein [Abditibacteriota bacterium]